MGDPQTYTCKELAALDIGTIIICHDEPNNTVWRVFLPNRIEMISHSGIPVRYLSDFAVDCEDKSRVKPAPLLSIVGMQAVSYPPPSKKEQNE